MNHDQDDFGHLTIIVDDFEGGTTKKSLALGSCERHPQAHILVNGECNWCLEEKYGPPDASDNTEAGRDAIKSVTYVIHDQSGIPGNDATTTVTAQSQRYWLLEVLTNNFTATLPLYDQEHNITVIAYNGRR